MVSSVTSWPELCSARWFEVPSCPNTSPRIDYLRFARTKTGCQLARIRQLIGYRSWVCALELFLGATRRSLVWREHLACGSKSLPRFCRPQSCLARPLLCSRIFSILLVGQMTRGNQREVDRQRAQARNAKSVTNKDKDGLTAAARKER